MKRKYFAWILLAAVLAGCASREPVPTIQTPPQPATTAPAETTQLPETTVPEETTIPPTTVPEHSELYIPGLPVEDVIRYFSEVCLDAEFVNAGNPKVVQKWMDPIRYRLQGDCTEEDLAVLERFVQWLNEMEGFPGMYPAAEEEPWNLGIHFCGQEEMLNIMGDQFAGTDGCVTFWYDSENVIYDATICYLTTLDQQLRNSVILEEIYNGLGPIQDTDLRPDSIIYSAFSQPQTLTEIDELLLKLLYHPDMRPGMTPEECEAVIRELYW